MQGLCIHLVTIVTKWGLFVVIYSELREKMETCEILTSQWREKVETLSFEVDDLVRMDLGNEVSYCVIVEWAGIWSDWMVLLG